MTDGCDLSQLVGDVWDCLRFEGDPWPRTAKFEEAEDAARPWVDAAVKAERERVLAEVLDFVRTYGQGYSGDEIAADLEERLANPQSQP